MRQPAGHLRIQRRLIAAARHHHGHRIPPAPPAPGRSGSPASHCPPSAHPRSPRQLQTPGPPRASSSATAANSRSRCHPSPRPPAPSLAGPQLRQQPPDLRPHILRGHAQRGLQQPRHSRACLAHPAHPRPAAEAASRPAAGTPPTPGPSLRPQPAAYPPRQTASSRHRHPPPPAPAARPRRAPPAGGTTRSHDRQKPPTRPHHQPTSLDLSGQSLPQSQPPAESPSVSARRLARQRGVPGIFMHTWQAQRYGHPLSSRPSLATESRLCPELGLAAGSEVDKKPTYHEVKPLLNLLEADVAPALNPEAHASQAHPSVAEVRAALKRVSQPDEKWTCQPPGVRHPSLAPWNTPSVPVQMRQEQFPPHPDDATSARRG